MHTGINVDCKYIKFAKIGIGYLHFYVNLTQK